MKTNKLILLGLICLTVAMPTTAQNRNEKKARTERAVKEAIAAKQYKINVDRMQPMRGGSRNLTTNYTLEIRNDSVFSYLPSFVLLKGEDDYFSVSISPVNEMDCLFMGCTWILVEPSGKMVRRYS